MKHLNESDANMASEPAALYYGTSKELRDSGILPELRQLGKEDTVWVIHFMQRHLDELTVSESVEDYIIGLSPTGGFLKTSSNVWPITL